MPYISRRAEETLFAPSETVTKERSGVIYPQKMGRAFSSCIFCNLPVGHWLQRFLFSSHRFVLLGCDHFYGLEKRNTDSTRKRFLTLDFESQSQERKETGDKDINPETSQMWTPPNSPCLGHIYFVYHKGHTVLSLYAHHKTLWSLFTTELTQQVIVLTMKLLSLEFLFQALHFPQGPLLTKSPQSLCTEYLAYMSYFHKCFAYFNSKQPIFLSIVLTRKYRER